MRFFSVGRVPPTADNWLGRGELVEISENLSDQGFRSVGWSFRDGLISTINGLVCCAYIVQATNGEACDIAKMGPNGQAHLFWDV